MAAALFPPHAKPPEMDNIKQGASKMRPVAKENTTPAPDSEKIDYLSTRSGERPQWMQRFMNEAKT
jgi:hypothetical protein